MWTWFATTLKTYPEIAIFLALALGYFFGNLEFVKRNFELVIIAIILISVLPAVWEALKARREIKAEKAAKLEETL